jgi:uncharacterized protein (TIGR03905 family)
MKKNLTYKTEGTCSREIEITVNSNIIESVKFYGGCPGNQIGISSLVVGMDVNEVIHRLEGIPCGNRGTSCPDQLAKALTKMKIEEEEAISCPA